MKFSGLHLPGLVEVTPSRHADDRGYFSEVYRADRFMAEVGPVTFVQENQSLSKAPGTLRGIHFQTDPHPQGKLVRCLAGAILDVAVDLRHGSPTYGQWAAVELTAALANQLWIPRGFGHAFCTLEPDTVVCYKVDGYYSAANDAGLLWNDPAIGIAWPEIADPATLSPKDRVQPRLADLPAHFHFEG